MIKTVTYIGSEEDITIELPAKWVVCYDCDGTGKTYLGFPASEQPAFTEEDMSREGPDFQFEYMNGHYDKQCPACKGRTTVLEIIKSEVNMNDPLVKGYYDYLEEERHYEALCAAERRMGC